MIYRLITYAVAANEPDISVATSRFLAPLGLTELRAGPFFQRKKQNYELLCRRQRQRRNLQRIQGGVAAMNFIPEQLVRFRGNDGCGAE